MAKRNLDMMDSLMQEVQEFYDNWTKRLDEITEKHDEEQRLQSKLKKWKKIAFLVEERCNFEKLIKSLAQMVSKWSHSKRIHVAYH